MRPLPLPALVGMDLPRLALLLLLVEPRLRGLVLAGGAGTAKSTLARGARSLCADQPFVELPLGADDEALLGGLDLEATLRQGRRVVRPGLLARAHNGIVAVDALNLLAEPAANLLLAALDHGELRVEREGLSLREATRFCLVGTYDPAEGLPRAHLLDRAGLIVTMPDTGGAAARSEVLRRHLRPEPDGWCDETEVLRGLVEAAREILPGVSISEEQQRQLVGASLAYGVEGQRADIFAVLAARASAALGLRDAVELEDLESAVRLVILPRATRPPQPPQAEAAEAEPEPEANSPQPGDTALDPEATPEPVEELYDALAVELPEVLRALPFGAQRRGRSGSRGATLGSRGRHVGSVPGDARRGRVDVAATLRTAARWQRLRPRPGGRVALRAEDLRIRRYRSKAGALFLFAVDASGSMALNRMRQAKGAVHALLQQAYVHRDRVALVAFRGESAELLLPPSGSVELARRAIDLLPTGGGTPIAAALLAVLGTAERARRRGIHNIVLMLLTDGRANVGLRCGRAQVDEELQGMAAAVSAAGVRSIVVDTQRNYLGQGNAQRLAGWLAGQYLYLPGASGDRLAAAATASARP